jgi:tetratricopeptide (TPR) repeat protein
VATSLEVAALTRRRAWLAIVADTLLTLAIIPLLINLTTLGRWWLLIPTGFLIVAAIAIKLRTRGPAPDADPPTLDEMAAGLARVVREKWQAVEQIRQVHDPFPIPVRWDNATETLVDHWENIHGRPAPLPLSGEISTIAKTYLGIPSGRLVVLGRAGAGKSTLAGRLVLDLLDPKRDHTIVPVVFELASWDPTSASLRDWLIERLTADYSVPKAAELVDSQRILPVLDGLDELAEGLRPEVIRALNRSLRQRDPLVLTSRPDEYAVAVEAADVLTATAVVQLRDLTVDDLAAYLPRTTRKLATSETKWTGVLNRLRDPAGDRAAATLRAVLTTPLMVALARTIYSDTAADPADLLDSARFPDEISLQNHLLDEFIPAAYSDLPQSRNHWHATDAERWLGFLAAWLRHAGTRDLAWWRLAYAIPVTVLVVGPGLIAAIITGAVGWPSLRILGLWDSSRPADDILLPAFSATLAGAPVFLMAWLRNGGLELLPGRWRPPFSDMLRGDPRRLATALIAGYFVVALTGFGQFPIREGRYSIWPLAGAAVLCTWFATGPMVSVNTPTTASPVALLRADRGAALARALVVSVLGLGGAVIWRVTGAVDEPLLLLMPIAAIASYLVFGASAWGLWIPARLWLALRGRLPWATVGFLEDAHRRGMLRYNGETYQFRHALIQDRLAARTPARIPRRETRWFRSTRGTRIDEYSWLTFSTAGQWIVGRDHPYTLAAQRNHAQHLLNRGRYERAETELLALLSGRRRALGKYHPTTVETWSELAYAHTLCGRYAAAEAEYKAVLHELQRKHGDDHPTVLSISAALAWATAKSGRFAESEAMIRRILESLRRVCGEKHPDTLDARHDLVWILGKLGSYEQAEREARATLSAKREVFGRTHRLTLRTRHDLAWLISLQGRLTEARAEYRAVLRARSWVIGYNHPETLTTRYDLACLVAAEGNLANARARHRRVLAKRRRLLGADHPQTVASREALDDVERRLAAGLRTAERT